MPSSAAELLGGLEVDHVKPVKDNGDWWDRTSNLQTTLIDPAISPSRRARMPDPDSPDVAEWRAFLES